MDTLQFASMAPLAMIVLYFVGTALTIANYVGYIRYNKDTYGWDFDRAYLTFTIISTFVFYIAASPLWLWSAKYASDDKDRKVKFFLGTMVILLFHDFPFFVMELHAILCCGWRNPFQGFVFIIQTMEFMISFIIGWLGYTWVASGFLENSSLGTGQGYGGTVDAYSPYGSPHGGSHEMRHLAPPTPTYVPPSMLQRETSYVPMRAGSAAPSGHGLKTGAETINILPPMSRQQSAARSQFDDDDDRYSSRRGLSEPVPVPFPRQPTEPQMVPRETFAANAMASRQNTQAQVIPMRETSIPDSPVRAGGAGGVRWTPRDEDARYSDEEEAAFDDERRHHLPPLTQQSAPDRYNDVMRRPGAVFVERKELL